MGEGTMPPRRRSAEVPQRRWPILLLMVCGVLGPKSNAHGPNEFLDLATARRITACVAMLVHAHGTR